MPQFVVQRVCEAGRVGGRFKTIGYVYRVLELDLAELMKKELKGEVTYVKRVNSKLVKRVVKEYSMCWLSNIKPTAIQAELLCKQLNERN